MFKVKFHRRSKQEQSAVFKKMREAGGRQDGEMTNREYAATPEFELKCMEAGVKNTKRQAAKYRNGYGSLNK
jgi:hypothetical protein